MPTDGRAQDPHTVKRQVEGFGDRIRRLRERASLNQEELAEAAGYSRRAATVSSWERGESFPPADRLLPIARALGVKDVHWLVTGEQLERDGEADFMAGLQTAIDLLRDFEATRLRSAGAGLSAEDAIEAARLADFPDPSEGRDAG